MDAGSDEPDDESPSSVRVQSTGPESDSRDAPKFSRPGRAIGMRQAALHRTGFRLPGRPEIFTVRPNNRNAPSGTPASRTTVLCTEPRIGLLLGGLRRPGEKKTGPRRPGERKTGPRRIGERTSGTRQESDKGGGDHDHAEPEAPESGRPCSQQKPRAKKRKPNGTLVCPIIAVFGPNSRRADRVFAKPANLRTRRRPILGTSGIY